MLCPRANCKTCIRLTCHTPFSNKLLTSLPSFHDDAVARNWTLGTVAESLYIEKNIKSSNKVRFLSSYINKTKPKKKLWQANILSSLIFNFFLLVNSNSGGCFNIIRNTTKETSDIIYNKYLQLWTSISNHSVIYDTSVATTIFFSIRCYRTITFHQYSVIPIDRRHIAAGLLICSI